MKSIIRFVIIALFVVSCNSNENHHYYDVIVIGEGTGAISAAIQSSRSKATTLYINPLPWLGGMLTSAGVSATDGNHKLPSGLWGEWRSILRDHYGGADRLFTGWVSNTMFEPKVGEQYWRQMAEEESNLSLLENQTWKTITKDNQFWNITLENGYVFRSKILIDGTDLGDVAAYVGADFDIGMEARSESKEDMSPLQSNDIIQDLTYVAILQDFGKGSDHTIKKPETYNADIYHCSCSMNCDDPKAHDCDKMLSYGKLPNQKYMINWPNHGNDYYANVIPHSPDERQSIYNRAKQHTLGFVYYIQTELGFSHLGLADEFPTEDGLALMPYHREGRRIKGLSRLHINHLLHPFDYDLYRAGIAVADYPVDHHHGKNEDAPEINFPSVPSYNIPIGCLLPKNLDNLIMADKAISVSNIVNGTTRLQPVIIQIGQAAGMIAALSIQRKEKPKDVPIRSIQNALLDADAYLMPYIDVQANDPDFRSIQKTGATGILRGTGIPFQWANQTWFYPDSLVETTELLDNLISFEPKFEGYTIKNQFLKISDFKNLITFWEKEIQIELKSNINIQLSEDTPLTRRTFSKLLQQYIDPFQLKPIDHNGQFKY